jgi:SAM-dependent methyltransferase
VLTDLSAEMLAVAARRAAGDALGNVETEVCSADDLPFADATFDTVSVRFGYMFFPDLDAATAELVRVLKPGGRLGASVWIEPDANPWTSLAMTAIADAVALPPTDPDGPNMFRCAAPGAVAARFTATGLRDVEEWDVDVQLVTDTPDEYWDVMSEHVSLAVAALRQVDDATRARIRAAAIAAVTPYLHDGAVRVPGRARAIAGTKATSSLGATSAGPT